MAAATMPAMPSKTRAPQRSWAREARQAPTRLRTPSRSAYAPNNSTNAPTVIPGQTKVTIPTRIAITPRSTKDHQFLARTIVIIYCFS
jgi:hypothetical protein